MTSCTFLRDGNAHWRALAPARKAGNYLVVAGIGTLSALAVGAEQ